MKYNDNGEYKDIYIKTFDTLPIGAIVEYSGATIPDGWTDIGNNQIEKTSQYIEGGAGLPSYFTTETDTGMKWIDGKTIYRKVVDFGALPNATTKSVNINATNVNEIVKVSFLTNNTSGGQTYYLPIPFYDTGTPSNSISAVATKTTVQITTGSNRSSWTAYVIVEYTKTS